MNKKFFSAVLMGALLLGGTFVSCQDYDDDIDNLQEQINKLASADQLSSKVSELQSAISAAQSAAEAKAAAANTVAEAAKKAAGDADAKAAAAQKAADDVKAAAGNYATKEEATAAANAAQKVANDLAAALEGALTEADVNAAIDTALKAALDKYATTEALQAVADELAKIQEAIAKCASEDDLKALADKVAAIETAGVPGVAAAVASIAAPAQTVNVSFEYARWNKKPTSGDKLKWFNALAEVYPEILDIEKDALIKQGGHLPVLVNPANVDLTEGYTFSLQTVDGNSPEVTVAKPVAGLVGATISGTTMTTRADGKSCFWTLAAEPKQISRYTFATLDEKQTASLVVEGADGTVLRTPFAYSVSANSIKNDVSIEFGQATYAEEIDLIAPGADGLVPLNIKGGYVGYQIVELTNAYQIQKYGLEIKDNHILVIKKMPADATSISVSLKVTALGLNGSTVQSSNSVVVGQKLVSNTEISPVELTLNGKDQLVKWAFEELDINDAVTLDNLMQANPKVLVTRNDENGNPADTIYNGLLKFYNGTNGLSYSTSSHQFVNGYGQQTDPDSFGFSINALTADATAARDARIQGPATYTVKVHATENNSNVVYKALPSTTLDTKLPKVTDEMIRVADGFNAGDYVRIIGNVDPITIENNVVTDGKVSFKLTEAFIIGKNTKFKGFKDRDTKDGYNYIISHADDPMKDSIQVNIWKDVTNRNETFKWNQVDNNRTIRATVTLFNNPANVATRDFTVRVVSPVYSADGSTVTFDNSKLVTKYDGAAIDVKAAFKSAVYAAGPKKGQTYNLFSGVTEEVGDQSKPITAGNYVMNKAGNDYVIVSSAYYIETFGWEPDYPNTTAPTGYKLKATDWEAGQERLEQFYTLNEQTGNLDVPIMVYAFYNLATETYDVNHGYYKYDATTNMATNYTASVDKSNLLNENATNNSTITWLPAYETPEQYNGTGYYKKVSLFELFQNDALVAIKKFYEEYRSKIGFMSTSSTPATKLAAEILCEPTIKFLDAKEAAKYVKFNGVDFTGDIEDDGTYTGAIGVFNVTPKSEAMVQTYQNVTLDMALVVKDKWGKTMYVPFQIKVNTK